MATQRRRFSGTDAVERSYGERVHRDRAALDGLGIALTFETLAEPFIRSGQLVRVLEDWSPAFDGYFVYFSGRRQVPAALRALIDMIRTVRGSVPARRPLQNPFTKD